MPSPPCARMDARFHGGTWMARPGAVHGVEDLQVSRALLLLLCLLSSSFIVVVISLLVVILICPVMIFRFFFNFWYDHYDCYCNYESCS